MLAIRLPPDIENRLESLARKTGRTKSFYVREALAEYLADLEDAFLAEKRWQEIRSGRTRPLSLREVQKRFR